MMEWSPFTTEKQKNELAQTEFRFFLKNTNNKITQQQQKYERNNHTGGVNTLCFLRPHERCTGAEDGRCQRLLRKQINVMEYLD
jgi:hypothetical protein